MRKFCGNERTKGNYAGEKQRHGNELIYVRNYADMREIEGK